MRREEREKYHLLRKCKAIFKCFHKNWWNIHWTDYHLINNGRINQNLYFLSSKKKKNLSSFFSLSLSPTLLLLLFWANSKYMTLQFKVQVISPRQQMIKITQFPSVHNDVHNKLLKILDIRRFVNVLNFCEMFSSRSLSLSLSIFHFSFIADHKRISIVIRKRLWTSNNFRLLHTFLPK